MGCSFTSGIQHAIGEVIDSPIVQTVAPIVAGYFLGPAAGTLLGTSASIGGAAAGALTGGALSAASGGNVLGGMLSGGMGGYAGAGFGVSPTSTASSAMSAWNALPSAEQNAYLSAGYTPLEIGSSIANIQHPSGGLFSGISSAYDAMSAQNKAGLFSAGLNAIGGLVQGNAARGAAQTSANAQIQAAKIAADAAKFRPVGVTTNFGASRFGYDANGNLTSAGYALNPRLQAQQDQLMNMSGGFLNQYGGAQAATAPMAQASSTMMGLGNNYLSTTPQQQAAKYMAEQQALLAAPRANQLANIQERLNAQGRGGLAIGGNAGQFATSPELAAYYNALQQQDLGLAAHATQGGMDYAKFGSGMVGAGGDMLKSMYGIQSDAYNPYATALGGATKLEGLGQNAMDMGINIGAKGTAATAQSGMLLGQGMTNAAKTMQDVNKISPWGEMLSTASSGIQNYWGK